MVVLRNPVSIIAINIILLGFFLIIVGFLDNGSKEKWILTSVSHVSAITLGNDSAYIPINPCTMIPKSMQP